MSKANSSDLLSKPLNDPRTMTFSQYIKGRFIGDGITLKMGFRDYTSVIRNTLFKKNNQSPNYYLPSKRVDFSSLNNIGNKEFNSTWLGHSSVMIHIGGCRILIDPVFEDRITPMKLARFQGKSPVDLEELADVDVVVISHDNLDHLNKYSIEILTPVTKKFLVPLGVSSYLSAWGIDREKIIELDWWQQYSLDNNLTFTATPARHFSGRGLFTRNKTLWSSWVIDSPECKLFFSGDSGYFDGFKEIGNALGPFDISYMQCGAYDRAWSQIQMTPEQAVKAHLELKGGILHPIHWGTFKMSFHAWDEPIQRLIKEANRHQVTLATPMAGETISPLKGELGSNWWEPLSNP